jgi:hypothetical protein
VAMINVKLWLCSFSNLFTTIRTELIIQRVSPTQYTKSLLEARIAHNFHDIVYVTGHAFGGMSQGISVEKLCSQFSSVAMDPMYPRVSKEDVKGIRH